MILRGPAQSVRPRVRSRPAFRMSPVNRFREQRRKNNEKQEGPMFAGDMRKAYALSLIDKFPTLPKGRPFPRIDLADIVAGLRERVQDPTRQDQGAAALCCPAAF